MKKKFVNKHKDIDPDYLAAFMTSRYSDLMSFFLAQNVDDIVTLTVEDIGEWEIPRELAIYCIELHQILASTLTRVSGSKVAFDIKSAKMYISNPEKIVRKKLRK